MISSVMGLTSLATSAMCSASSLRSVALTFPSAAFVCPASGEIAVEFQYSACFAFLKAASVFAVLKDLPRSSDLSMIRWKISSVKHPYIKAASQTRRRLFGLSSALSLATTEARSGVTTSSSPPSRASIHALHPSC